MKIFGFVLPSMIIAFLIFLSLSRNSIWHTELSLWMDTLEKQQRSPKPRTLLNLGDAYKKIGDYENAEACYRKILKFAPYHHQARLFRAVMLIKLERYKEALKELEMIEHFYKNVLPHFPEKKKAVEKYFKEEDLYNAINEVRKRSVHD